MDATNNNLELELPGFRFHPTEEELLDFYLKKMVSGKNAHYDIVIGFLNIYLYDPWLLPGLSKIGEREWYFFVPRDRKHGSGSRPSRTTENGFWKATGSDRKIFSLSDPKKLLGLKKTLVFYKGRAPRGSKTDWIMNEYRLPDYYPSSKDIALCKIYRKATSLKVLEQRAAIEEETKTFQVPSPDETLPFYTHSDDLLPETPIESCHVASDNPYEFHTDEMLLLLEDESKNATPHTPVTSIELPLILDEKLKQEPDISSNDDDDNDIMSTNNKVSSLRLPIGEGNGMMQLQLPKTNMDWTQDAFWTQICSSPWLDNIMLASPYANILNI